MFPIIISLINYLFFPYLSPCFSGSLCFCCHGSLEVLREPNILHLHPLYLKIILVMLGSDRERCDSHLYPRDQLLCQSCSSDHWQYSPCQPVALSGFWCPECSLELQSYIKVFRKQEIQSYIRVLKKQE